MAKNAKKASKRFAKAQKKTTSKTYAKKRKAHQIASKEDVKASKRAARGAQGRSGQASRGERGEDDKLKGVETMDDLLQSDIFAGSDDEDEEGSDDDGDRENLLKKLQRLEGDLDGAGSDDDDDLGGESSDEEGGGELGGGGGSSSSKSRGGALDGDDGEEDAEVAQEDTFDAHQQELEQLKKSDPAFYQYLLENDQQLLDFRDFSAGMDDDDEPAAGAAEGSATGDAAKGGAADSSDSSTTQGVLTMERWELLASNAGAGKHSFPALRAVAGAFRSVVRILANVPDTGEQGAKTESKKAKMKRQDAEAQKQQGVFQIEDEAVHAKVMEWVFANVSGVLDHHLGAATAAAQGAGDKNAPKKRKLYDVAKSKKWQRIKAISRVFMALCQRQVLNEGLPIGTGRCGPQRQRFSSPICIPKLTDFLDGDAEFAEVQHFE